MGVASLVMGIVALVLSVFGGFGFLYWPTVILGIAGIILGAVGKKNGGPATAGMVISIVAVAVSVIYYIACAAMLA